MMNQKILLVDDEPAILDALRRQFGKQFDIDVAHSGREALSKLSPADPYAVIVADMRMPQMNGVELLKQVHAAAPNTVRMMLTGFADKQTAEDAVRDGHVFHFLSKPCSPEVLGQAIEACLELYRLTQKINDLQASLRNIDG